MGCRLRQGKVWWRVEAEKFSFRFFIHFFWSFIFPIFASEGLGLYRRLTSDLGVDLGVCRTSETCKNTTKISEKAEIPDRGCRLAGMSNGRLV